MNQQRVEQLEKMRKESPDDPFLIYALAIEYQHQNKQYAVELFTKLLDNHPDYLATYFHAALLFSEIDELDKTISIYEKGIELAQKLNDLKALAELQNAYQNFLIENDI